MTSFPLNFDKLTFFHFEFENFNFDMLVCKNLYVDLTVNTIYNS